MPVVQSTFADDFAVGYPGMVANGETSNRLTRTIEDAGGIAFGRAAFRGAADHGCTATPAAGTFLGIAIADKGVPMFEAGQAADTFPQYHNVPLFQRGTIWVTNGPDAVADGDPVYVTPAGVYTNLPAAGANFRLGDFVYDGTYAAAQLARISNNRAPAA